MAGAELDGSRRHKHEVFGHCLDLLGPMRRSDVVMVGDREHDGHGASVWSLPFVGVLWGYGAAEERAGAGAVRLVDKPAHLVAAIDAARDTAGDAHRPGKVIRTLPRTVTDLKVRSDIGLGTLHQVLQAAFGWTDSHLHRFALGGSPFDRNAELFLCPYDAEEGEDDGTPAKDVTWTRPCPRRATYCGTAYDYGDSWDLAILLEAVDPLVDSAPVAVCIDGRRAAPPEDCGGLREAADLVQVLDDPAHFDLDEINRMLDDPYMAMRDTGVDSRLVEILDRLRYTEVGDDLVLRVMSLTQDRSKVLPEDRAAALHPHLWFLDRVGDDGLALTSAGYLKPEDVTAAAAVIPAMAHWIGTANREAHTIPVLEFRESLQHLGLLGKYRGRILLSKAGSAARGNPDTLWRHMTDRLPLGKTDSMDVPAGLLALLLIGSTPGDEPSLHQIAQALGHLGWRHSDRTPVSADTARGASADTLGVLENVTVGPRPRREKHQISDTAATLARDALRSEPRWA